MALKEALTRYRAARDAWATMAAAAKGAYVDDISFGLSNQLSGHWADRVAGIDKDLADMEARAAASDSAKGKGSWARAAEQVRMLTERQRSRPRCQHMPPKSFRPGRPVAVELGVEAGYRLATARLHYRHVNQADEYRIVDLSGRGGRYGSEIPSAYTDSPYPLMYFFELHDARGDVWLHPGLNVDLSNQPYFVVRRA